MPAPATLNEALVRAAEVPDVGLRLLDRDETAEWRSWGEILQRSRRVAAGLGELGVEPGDVVASIYPSSWGFFDAFFGVVLAGAIPAPLYPPVRLGRMAEYHRSTAAMISAVEARLVLAGRSVKRFLGEAVQRSNPPLGCLSLAELPRAGGERQGSAETDDLALVQYSSGTTVAPKPVALSHRAVMSQVLTLNAFWPDDEHTRHTGVSWLPLYHDMGLIGCVFTALERPATLTMIPPEVFVARPAIWLRTIGRYAATISPAPNFAYGLCASKIRDDELQGVDLSCWRVALNGAERVSPRVMREFCSRFSAWGFRRQAMTPVYGLSEATLAVTFSPPDREFLVRRFRSDRLGPGDGIEESETGTEIASLGPPLPGSGVEIRSADGSVVPQGVVGRVWTRGPSLMSAYLNRPAQTAKVMMDGWLDTGDLGFQLDGELYLTGRAKNLIIMRGQNHAPEHLELAIDGLPGVRRGCTVAVSTSGAGAETERLLLFVERDRSATDDQVAALPALCRERMLAAAGVAPDVIEVVEPGTLPRTSSGKLRREATLERYLAGTLRPPETVGPALMLRELIKSKFAYWRAGVVKGWR